MRAGKGSRHFSVAILNAETPGWVTVHPLTRTTYGWPVLSSTFVDFSRCGGQTHCLALEFNLAIINNTTRCSWIPSRHESCSRCDVYRFECKIISSFSLGMSRCLHLALFGTWRDVPPPELLENCYYSFGLKFGKFFFFVVVCECVMQRHFDRSSVCECPCSSALKIPRHPRRSAQRAYPIFNVLLGRSNLHKSRHGWMA